jgi:HK97 gp10 family phage protein
MATRNAASITVRTVVRSNNTGRLVTQIRQHARATVDTTAGELQVRASQLAPKDTRALSNSIYVNNGDVSDYSERVSVASGLNPDMVALEEIDPEFVISVSTSPGNDTYLSVVGVAAHYGLFQELGTSNNRAQPFMFPAALGVEGDFEQAMALIVG